MSGMSLFSLDVSVPEQQPGLKVTKGGDVCEQELKHFMMKDYPKYSYFKMQTYTS